MQSGKASMRLMTQSLPMRTSVRSIAVPLHSASRSMRSSAVGRAAFTNDVAAASEKASSLNPASRPFARHRPDLPQPRSFRIPMLLLITFSALTWSAFAAHSTNRERLSSSVLKSIVDKLGQSQQVRDTIGDDVHLKREAWLAGDPWIRGSVNMMKGRVDMSFKIVGSIDSGTVYFSAIRRDAQTPYETLRFLIILDSNKQVVSLLD